MEFTIQEVAEKFNLSPHTLRFYDKEGLLPFISRNKAGNRVFTEVDIDWLTLVCCLKDTGMPIKEIKIYSDWCKEGSGTIDARKEMLAGHRQTVLEQIKALYQSLSVIDKKIAFYDNPDNVHRIDQHRENRDTVSP